MSGSKGLIEDVVEISLVVIENDGNIDKDIGRETLYNSLCLFGGY